MKITPNDTIKILIEKITWIYLKHTYNRPIIIYSVAKMERVEVDAINSENIQNAFDTLDGSMI